MLHTVRTALLQAITHAQPTTRVLLNTLALHSTLDPTTVPVPTAPPVRCACSTVLAPLLTSRATPNAA